MGLTKTSISYSISREQYLCIIMILRCIVIDWYPTRSISLSPKAQPFCNGTAVSQNFPVQLPFLSRSPADFLESALRALALLHLANLLVVVTANLLIYPNENTTKKATVQGMATFQK